MTHKKRHDLVDKFPQTRSLGNELCGCDRRENQAEKRWSSGPRPSRHVRQFSVVVANNRPSRFEICCKLLNDLSRRRSAEWKHACADRKTFSARRMRGCCQLPRRIRLKSAPAIKPKNSWPAKETPPELWMAAKTSRELRWVASNFRDPFRNLKIFGQK